NNIGKAGDEYRVTLTPGSKEDDIAHELMHALMESEGYAKEFMISQIPRSAALHPFIASDFDHIIINQRLHREGYYPERGFMANMKDQYKSWVNRKGAVLSPEQRAIFGVANIHELMKHVIYVESPRAEKELLDT